MKDAAELVKVAAVGTLGFLGSVELKDAATLTSIGVGLATIAYVLTKLYFLIRNKGKEPRP